MCGIAGYIGPKNAISNIFEMLKSLEYRGYDSAGIAYIEDGLKVVKDQGRVEKVRLQANLKSKPTVALGHSRWATHGPPSQINAHPHTDNNCEVAIVHNGIIENYSELRSELKRCGHKFESETDSEVIVHLIAEGLKTDGFEEAFLSAIRRLDGSFAILAIYDKNPDILLFARNESPLLIGLGKDENFLASDMPAVLPKTKRAIILDDMEYGIVTATSVIVKDISSSKEVKKSIHISNLSVESAEKGGHEHFMLKEMLEESAAVKNALKSRKDIEKIAKKIKGAGSVYLVACGTAWHAGFVAKYILQANGISAHSEVASEFRYSAAKSLKKEDLIILISQSGETADTLAAAKVAKKAGAKTIAIVNVVGSSLSRVADESIYTHSGPEIAVASTKVYLGQVTALSLLCLELLKNSGNIDETEYLAKIKDLGEIPSKIDIILDNRERIAEVAKLLEKTEDYFYIARRQNYPTAMEGALKLKEISYLHAEAYPGGELKHGPLALMEEKVCVVAITPNDEIEKKMRSNIEEIRTRGAKLLELCEGDTFRIENSGDIKITVPKTDPLLTPLTMVVPLHLLSYYVALSKGLNIDKPRNLAKSVTVE